MKTHLTFAMLAATSANLLAGVASKSAEVVTPKSPSQPDNPLSFYGGALVLDFNEMIRAESRDNNFDFNSGINALTDDSWFVERTRIGLLYKPLSWLKVYAQAQDTREFGSDRPNRIGQLGAEGDDAFDLRQAWIELGDPSKGLSAKIGRQVLNYGDQRLIGPLDWTAPSRTFDAAKIRYQDSKWWVDVFAASSVRFNKGRINTSDLTSDADSRHQLFSGVYFSSTLLDFQVTDLYALHLHENYTRGDTNFVTLGLRMKGDPKKLANWDYDKEMAFQTGKVAGKNLTAFAGHWGVGYNIEGPWTPRIGMQYNYATGDSNAADGKVGTFQNLFPTNHLYYGYMDVFSWQNISNPSIDVTVKPHKDVSVNLAYHLFWLADTNDAWYRANGTTAVRPIKSSASSYAGSELDLTVTWKATKNLTLQAGYSHFFAGDYLKTTGSGAHSDANFGYLQATVNF